MIAREEKLKPFDQQVTRVDNEFSINIPIRFSNVAGNGLLAAVGLGPKKKGWVNVTDPCRHTLVLGTPGSGKTYFVIREFVRQQIEKGYAMYLYDLKPDLARYAYGHYLKNGHQYERLYGVPVQFLAVNFDDPRRSHRINPLAPEGMTDILDAKEAARAMLLNLHNTWIQKSGDFYVESAINYLQACIWYLKKYYDKTRDLAWLTNIRRELNLVEDDNFDVCTFPHVIELLSRDYKQVIPMLLSEPELQDLMQPYAPALDTGNYEQLEGLLSILRIPLESLHTANLYWVLSGHDAGLDLNNPEAPKILCVSGNIEKQLTYGAPIGLITARVIRETNQTKRTKFAFTIDESSSIYIQGLDTLIYTGRRNKISVTLETQDTIQLDRLYGTKTAKSMLNNFGTVFSGQVIGETAQIVSEFTDGKVSTEQIGRLLPGEFVGKVNRQNEGMNTYRVFHGQLGSEFDPDTPDNNENELPVLSEWQAMSDEDVDARLIANYNRIKQDIDYIIRTQSTPR